jgi:hypothetical protein
MAGMSKRESFSIRRVLALLFYAFAAFMACLFATILVSRLFWRSGYSVMEDVIVLSVMALLAISSALVGYLLRPGSFSLRTMFIGVTFVVIVIAELAILVRSK